MKKKALRMKTKAGLLIMLALHACIGVDEQNAPLVGERIDVSQSQAALLPGQTLQLSAVYYDPFGVATDVALTWTSSNPEAVSVDATGLVTALAAGQSVVRAAFGRFTGPDVNVNVVADASAVASVTVSAPKTTLNTGETITLSVTVTNFQSDTLTNVAVEWFSENAAILQSDGQGQFTALTNGVAAVHAKVNGVKSNSVDITVGADRTGQFVPAGGYAASGTATLRTERGQLILELGDDFQTSFALGTFIYLANSTNASTVRSSGLEIAEIRTNGAKTFIVSDVNPNVRLFDYRYVVILCKPATVTFGYADLE